MKTLQDIMTKDCVTVAPQDSIYEAAVKMKNHDIGFIPVVEGGQMIGVVTDRDLVIRGYAEHRPDSSSIKVLVSQEVVTASPKTTVDEAAKMMASHQVRRLPVVENGRLLGVVAIGDLAVRQIFENEAGEALSEISEPGKQPTRAN